MAIWGSARWDSGHWSAVEGVMAATETGSDTFAASGVVVDRGYMAAVETTSDTFAAEGIVVNRGYMAAVETTQDTFFATGYTEVVGAMAATETTRDTFAATGIVTNVGYMAAVETTSDVFAATGEVTAPKVTGYMAAQESTSDTFAATGEVIPKPPVPLIVPDIGDEKQRKKALKKRDAAFEKYKREQTKLREQIERAINPVRATEAPVAVAQDDTEVSVLSADGTSVRIEVPGLFNPEEVARVLSEALNAARIEVMRVQRKQDAERAIAQYKEQMARLMKRRRDDELLMLMD